MGSTTELTEIIKIWRLGDKTILVCFKDDKLQLTIKQADQTIAIAPHNIVGLPKTERLDKQLVKDFFSNAYPQLTSSSDGKYMLQIQQKLKGGGNTIDPDLEPEKLWPNGIVPYQIDLERYPVGSFERKTIKEAIQIWKEANTGFQFIPRTTEANYLMFDEDPEACYSEVGYAGGGVQYIRCHLEDGIFDQGSIIHEIGHAIGLLHEHQRRDRTHFVTVSGAALFAHINDYGMKGQPHGTYDFDSIMHYPVNTRLSDGQKIDVKRNITRPYTFTGSNSSSIGAHQTLSQGDKAAAKYLAEKIKFFASSQKQSTEPGTDGHYAKVTTKHPVDILNNKAHDYFEQGDYKQAYQHWVALLDEYDEVLSKETYSSTLYNCGVCCSQCGHNKDAMRYFEDALEIDPNNTEASDKISENKPSKCSIM